MNKDNPFSRIDKTKKANDFIKGATGDTHKDNKANKKGKYFALDIDVNERLEAYVNSEVAKKYESRGYIMNQALDIWLKNKGF